MRDSLRTVQKLLFYLFFLCSTIGMEYDESRAAPSTEPASDDSASPFNRQPGERDRLDFEPVPLRYREDGLTPDRQRAYVEALADCGIAREAAARIGVSEQSINRVRRRSDARSFDRASEAAHMFGARRLRSIAFERAIEGVLKGHYYHGELVSQERVYDNRLLTYLLGKVEHFLEPSDETRAVFGNWEPCIEALEQALPPPDPDEDTREDEVWRQDDGQWRTCFPPPDGFDGFEEGEWDGLSWYCRSLTEPEQAAIDADGTAERAQACARRDRFFGFAENRISSTGEAEPYEASKTSDPDSAPIEYKPLTPPSFRRKPESSNMKVRSPDRSCSWIPDQVRDDDDTRPPSFRRKPEPMGSKVRSPDRRRVRDKSPAPAGGTGRTFPPARAFPR